MSSDNSLFDSISMVNKIVGSVLQGLKTTQTANFFIELRVPAVTCGGFGGYGSPTLSNDAAIVAPAVFGFIPLELFIARKETVLVIVVSFAFIEVVGINLDIGFVLVRRIHRAGFVHDKHDIKGFGEVDVRFDVDDKADKPTKNSAFGSFAMVAWLGSMAPSSVISPLLTVLSVQMRPTVWVLSWA